MRSPNHYYYTSRRLFAKAVLFPQFNWGFLYAKAPTKIANKHTLVGDNVSNEVHILYVDSIAQKQTQSQHLFKSPDKSNFQVNYIVEKRNILPNSQVLPFLTRVFHCFHRVFHIDITLCKIIPSVLFFSVATDVLNSRTKLR